MVPTPFLEVISARVATGRETSRAWLIGSASLITVIPLAARAEQPRPRATVGAYYFDGWTGQTFHITELLQTEFADRKPVWGWKDDTIEIMQKQIDDSTVTKPDIDTGEARAVVRGAVIEPLSVTVCGRAETLSDPGHGTLSSLPTSTTAIASGPARYCPAWNSVDVGPKRDVLGEFCRRCEKPVCGQVSTIRSANSTTRSTKRQDKVAT